MVVSIDDIKTTASVAANASISTKGGAVSVSAQSLNQIDPNKLWLVNLYAPFDGIEASGRRPTALRPRWAWRPARPRPS